MASVAPPGASIGRILGDLKECSRRKDLRRGELIHREVSESGLLLNLHVANTLINMYAKCRNMAEAQKLFDSLPRRDVVSWNCLIQGYVDNNRKELALDLYECLEGGNAGAGACVPNSKTYLAALTACSDLATRTRDENWLEKGKFIHQQAVKRGCCDLRVETTLVYLYAKSGSLIEARRVFDGMINRDVASWNCIIQAYVDNDQSEAALQMFDRMKNSCVPDSRTYIAAAGACTSLAAREDGPGKEFRCFKYREKAEEIHSRALASGCCEMFLQAALINLYSQCGCMAEARGVFDSMKHPDVVCWTALLQGYVANGECELALELYRKMESIDQVRPDAKTFVVALTACASLAATENSEKMISRWLSQGEALHSQALESSACDVFVSNALIDMYSKCGSMERARELFDKIPERNVVSWNSLLQGYVDNAGSEVALELFDEMRKTQAANARTYVAALNACSALGARGDDPRWLEKGRALHQEALKRCCWNVVVETTLVGMYSSCGSMFEAREVFDRMIHRDLVSWNCLAQGYVKNGENEPALELISLMEKRNSATFAAALEACGNLLALELGKTFHEELRRSGLEDELAVSLVEFYGRVGKTDAAELLFDRVSVEDIWAWNSLLAGYSQRGEALRVLELFQELREQGVSPNEFTFTHLLAACSHAGLTEKGKLVFRLMESRYGIAPDGTHYNCLVDLLARANFMEEALRVVEEMPHEANSVTWTVILSGCRKWNNVEVAEVAYEFLLGADDKDSAAYSLMANIYGTKNFSSSSSGD